MTTRIRQILWFWDRSYFRDRRQHLRTLLCIIPAQKVSILQNLPFWLLLQIWDAETAELLCFYTVMDQVIRKAMEFDMSL